MQNILDTIEELKQKEVKDVIDRRMKEFEEVGRMENREVFKELCFCFMTANFSAEGGMRIQQTLGDDFLKLSQEDLAKRLQELSHRFPNMRSKFVVHARENHANSIKDTLDSLESDREARDWIVRNIKGIGMKEASHFLRNIGYKNIAILDFHIIDYLAREGLIEKPKTLTPKRYGEIEKVLEQISDKTGLNLGELDLYLWYKETGKVLK
ncbi:MAG: N-glycosylase/DNA lyase, partial [Candidatus Pacearchaeota archaeon]